MGKRKILTFDASAILSINSSAGFTIDTERSRSINPELAEWVEF
jgi:hypothetical protein